MTWDILYRASSLPHLWDVVFSPKPRVCQLLAEQLAAQAIRGGSLAGELHSKHISWKMMIPTWSQTAGEAPTHALHTPTTFQCLQYGSLRFWYHFPGAEWAQGRAGGEELIWGGGLPLGRPLLGVSNGRRAGMEVRGWDSSPGAHAPSTAAEMPPRCEGDRGESTADMCIFLLEYFVSFLRHWDELCKQQQKKAENKENDRFCWQILDKKIKNHQQATRGQFLGLTKK